MGYTAQHDRETESRVVIEGVSSDLKDVSISYLPWGSVLDLVYCSYT